MNWTKRVGYSLLLSLLVAWGCESVALMPRADVDGGDVARGDYERDRDTRGDVRDRYSRRDEVVGTIQRVDERNRIIQLRTTEGRVTDIKYDSSTRVYSRDQEMQVESLRRGDLILVQVEKDSRGEQYAGLIRMNDRQDFGTRR